MMDLLSRFYGFFSFFGLENYSIDLFMVLVSWMDF